MKNKDDFAVDLLRRIRETRIRTDGGISEIANDNLWAIPISLGQCSGFDEVEMLSLVTQAYEALKRIWRDDFCFYCWYDDMAGQIRFSTLPIVHESELPFQKSIAATSLEEVIHRAFQLDRHGVEFDCHELPIYKRLTKYA